MCHFHSGVKVENQTKGAGSTLFTWQIVLNNNNKRANIDYDI